MAIKNIEIDNKKFTINYEMVNQKADVDVIFLHGWASNKEIMKHAFGNTLNNYRHIYIDMPGFGKSPNEYVLTTSDYSNIIELFLKEIGAKKDIIVGHSFGGKVAALLNPNTLVLLSSAGIVENKPLDVKLKIATFKLLKKAGFGKFYGIFASKDAKGMEKNMYETLKNVVDEDFTAVFANFKNRAIIFWGEEDKATSLESGKKIASLIKQNSFFPLSGDHFFFLKHANFIGEEVAK